MGLCEVVASLADTIAAKYADRSGWHDLLLHILRSAPIYREAGRLDAWDEAFRYVRGKEDSPSRLTELLDAIADLGTYNLYGAFDAPGTQREYDRVAQVLRAEGVRVPPGLDVLGW